MFVKALDFVRLHHQRYLKRRLGFVKDRLVSLLGLCRILLGLEDQRPEWCIGWPFEVQVRKAIGGRIAQDKALFKVERKVWIQALQPRVHKSP